MTIRSVDIAQLLVTKQVPAAAIVSVAAVACIFYIDRPPTALFGLAWAICKKRVDDVILVRKLTHDVLVSLLQLLD